MPGTATTILVDGTPTDYIDLWIDSLVGGGAWKDSDGGTVTIQWTAFQGTMDGQNSYGWTSLALTGLREALSLWESVANIDFVEVSGAANADVKFWWGTEAQAGGSDVLGWSDLPGFSDTYDNPASEVRDVLFNAQDSSMGGALEKGGLGLVTMVHEIGHLLGLAHPHDGGAGSDATTFPGVTWWDPYSYGTDELNQGIYTTMSYNFGWPSLFPEHESESWGLQYGPMALDIAAIQAIYGANTNYASGGNIYKLPTSNGTGTYWSSIWDTGGIDTISNEGSSNNSTIDLRAAEAGSSGGGYVSYTFNSGAIIEGGYTIARNVVIENAIGGSGNDTITGNAADNRLEGGAGFDRLDGGAGADTMIGGSGGDTYYVDNVADVIVELYAGGEIDTVYSSLANYTLGENLENLTLSGTESIKGAGNSLANTIVGNSGNNVLRGGGGDTLDGRSGNDRLIVDDVSFAQVDGGEGTDTLALGGAGLVLDLTGVATLWKLAGIERIDLTGTGDNTLIIDEGALFSRVGEHTVDKNVLVVERDLGDVVQFAELGWTKTGSFTNADGAFDRWVYRNNEVHVEQVTTTPLPPGSILLSKLDGNTGFKLAGVAEGDNSGWSVASAGDVNGDGFDDVIVGAQMASEGPTESGASYVIFGKASGFSSSIDLSTLNGSNGFKLSGVNAYDNSGRSVSSAGDVNGDGFADIIIGAGGGEWETGASYVIFGKASGFGADINLATLSGSNGFKLSGAEPFDDSGWSVASAGDFNADGYDDLVIGAIYAGSYTGMAYIVYGKASGFAANMDLSDLTAAKGVKLSGVSTRSWTGYSVASAGDVNGDGFDDVIVGAMLAGRASADGSTNPGASYVVFGRASGSANINLSNLNGSNGFKLSGATGEFSGRSVASAGDVNGDGYADLIVGAANAEPNGHASGAGYVVFGKASGFTANLNLSGLDGSNGFKLSGAESGDFAGFSVDSAGDFNGDGFADLLIGAHGASSTVPDAGASYIVFGKASGFAANIDLSSLDGSNGLALWGEATYGWTGSSVSSAGDVNGDGYEDLIIGARGIAANGTNSGASYVVFGGAFGGSTTPVTTTGTAASEILIGGRGNDVLTGGGGGDVFHAGAGNDRLVVNDVSFRLVDGGTGIDTLVLNGPGLMLDLSSPMVAARLEGIERIDLSSPGDNVLTVSQLAILGGVGAVVGGKHVLVVEASPGDRVVFVEPDWKKIGSFFNADGWFDRWVFGNAEVHVERELLSTNALPLWSLNGSNGFKLSGEAAGDWAGFAVASAGDLNGDGFADLIVGATSADRNGSESGASYVVFGKASGFAANIDLSTLNGATGFKLNGAAALDVAGRSVASAGDVNGDGFDDLIIGALIGGPGGNRVGAGYVVFGKATGFAANIDLSSLDGSSGFRLSGVAAGDWTGFSVASAGDVNGDGYDDLIVGAPYADPHGGNSGATYVVFGKASGFAANINLASLNGSTGFRLSGAALDDQSGGTAASAGDINGDGYDDLVIGAPFASPNGALSGASYVVFGKAAGFAANLDLSTLNGSTGFRLVGAAGDRSGTSVASAGDVNGDGYDDLIIGAPFAGADDRGASYVVFGKASGFAASIDLSTLNGSNGFKLGGAAISDWAGYSVASAGDINGDGLSDLIVGAGNANAYGARTGVSYVLFGKASGFAANIDLANLGSADGFRVLGETEYDSSGGSVASAGDVNGDGYDDLIVGARTADPHGADSGAGYVVFGGAFGGAGTPVTTTGTTAAEILIGGRGNDVLTGGGGGDVFHAGAGNDRLTVANLAFRLVDGGTGTDTLVLGGADLTLDLTNPSVAAKLDGIERIDLTGTGNNTLIVSQLAVLGSIGAVLGGKHILVVEGNSGDKVQFAESTWTQAGSFTNADGTFDRWVLGNAEVHIEQVASPSVMGRTIVGTAGADVISTTETVPGQPLAADGGDTIDGRAGADTMAGGLGDDTYIVDNAGDLVIELTGEGTDTVSTSVDYTLAANVENLVLTGTANIDGTGNGLANSLTGNAGSNMLNGSAGADTMAGGRGSDTYVVDQLDDIVVEAASGGVDLVRSSVSYILGANVENLVLAGVANVDGTGNELRNALTGNAGNNMLDGAAGNDAMTGGLGDDTYVVDAAGDVIAEGVDEGTDTVNAWLNWTLGANLEQLKLMGMALNGTGNSLNNVLTGNAGKNVLNGGAGVDMMTGGLGDDTYVVDRPDDVIVELANEGTDTVQASISWTLGANVENLVLTGTNSINGTGNELANVLTGNAGKNVLDGGAGADTMAGGVGDDTYVVDTASDKTTELASGGIDTVLSSVNWTLGANIERLTLVGIGSVNGIGNDLANTLTGNAGNNILDGKAGADTMNGGLGDDTYIVDDVGDILSEGTAAGIDTVQSAVTWQLKANFENLILAGTSNLDGTGNNLANVLTGNAGNNRLAGGVGADTMEGGRGNDIYIVDNRDDLVVEAARGGVDEVQASVTYTLTDNVEGLTLTGSGHLNGTGNDLANTLTGNAGNNRLDGGAGADTMAGGLGNDTYIADSTGDLVTEAVDGGTDTVRASISYALRDNVENLVLTGTDAINGTGNALANAITGNAVDNLINGGGGADRMEGGAGNDIYIVDNAGDLVVEGAGGGADGVQASISYTLTGNVEKLTLTGIRSIDGTGNGLANELIGNTGSNRLDGGAGADTMTGGAGNDTYIIDNAGDLVTEAVNGGTDTVQASVSHALSDNIENLVLTGTDAINGTGNALANAITGNAGHNILDGGLGADTLAGGGGGGDTFRFSTALGPDNVDRIIIFDHAADTIQLDHSIFTALGIGALAAGAFNKGAVATQADDRILYDSTSKSLYYDADGLGGVDAMKFATFNKGGLDHTDFLIV